MPAMHDHESTIARSRTGCRQRAGGERGNASIEMIAAIPLLMAVLMIALQYGLCFHARSVALASAQQGARTSAALHADLGIGLRDAREFAAQTGVLSNLAVTGSRSATSTTVTVRGDAIRLIPGWDTAIVQSSTLPVERVT